MPARDINLRRPITRSRAPAIAAASASAEPVSPKREQLSRITGRTVLPGEEVEAEANVRRMAVARDNAAQATVLHYPTAAQYFTFDRIERDRTNRALAEIAQSTDPDTTRFDLLSPEQQREQLRWNRLSWPAKRAAELQQSYHGLVAGHALSRAFGTADDLARDPVELPLQSRFSAFAEHNRANTRALQEFGVARQLERYQVHQDAARALPNNPMLAAVLERGSASDLTDYLIRNPGSAAGLVTSAVVPSVVGMVGAVGGGLVGGVPGAAAGAGLFTYGMEGALELEQALRERGINLDQMDAKQLVTLLRTEHGQEAYQAALRQARLKGLGTGFVAGVAVPASLLRIAPRHWSPGKRVAAIGAVQLPTQAGLEGAGEAAGQFLARGHVNMAEVVAESVAGGVMAIAEVPAYRAMLLEERARVQEPGKPAPGVEQLIEVAKDTKTDKFRVEHPDGFARYLREKAARGEAPSKLQVDPDALAQWAAAQGKDLDEVLQQVGTTRREFAIAQSNGMFVSLDVADTLTQEYAEDLLASVKKDSKLGLHDYTATEAELLAEAREADVVGQAVEDVIVKVVKHAGRSTEEAQAMGQLWRVWAENYAAHHNAVREEQITPLDALRTRLTKVGERVRRGHGAHAGDHHVHEAA